ncbi:hypothetical protein CJ030_MR2G009207 [Morella rubra]|uniref:Myb/SANT-like domain-containing protein n=1 Tax=Morella rubra TaxID=262757 RepID=A0A6A1WF37_9ROSI|nr:hypothetical protein CJ030_MR2G009207 [Morella rubra]
MSVSQHTLGMRSVWSSNDVQYLLMNFIEEKNKNNIVGHKVTDKLMWERVLSKMVLFMPGLTVICIKNKWKSLRKDYKAVTILRNEGGVFWNPSQGTVTGADDGWWDTMEQKCQKTKRFRRHGCEHVDLMDMLWKDSAKGACDSDSLQRHGPVGGSSTASFKMGPNSVPPMTSMDTGSRKRRSAGSSGAPSHRSTGKAPVIDVEMTKEQMFEYSAEKRRRCQGSFTADVDVPEVDFVAALEATGFPGGLDSIPSGDHGLDYLEGEDKGQEAAPVKEQHDPDHGSLSRPTDQKRLTEQSNLSRPTNQNRLTDQSSTDVLTDHDPSDIYASRSTSRSQTDQDQLKTRSERSGSVTTLFMERSLVIGFLP